MQSPIIADPTKIFKKGFRRHDTALRNFYKAAAEFYESKVWVGLSATQHREFGLSRPIKPDHTVFSPFVVDVNLPAPALSTSTTLPLGQPVVLCHIQSAAHSHYNGARGELICKRSNEQGRWQVRVCRDGKRMNLKSVNFHINPEFDQWGIVKICGADGRNGGYLFLNQCYADIFSRVDVHHPTQQSSDCIGPSIVCEFYDPNELGDMLNHHLAQHRRIKAPLANAPPLQLKDGSMRKTFFPVVSSTQSYTFTIDDYLMLEAALRSSVTFLQEHLYTHRLPPHPHPNGYTFAPTTIPLQLRDGLRVRCAFPHGEMHAHHRIWSSYPSFVRQSEARRPSHVKTIAQAVVFHQAGVAAFESNECDRAQLLAQHESKQHHTYAQHLYGLANALWESESLDNVVEAVAITKLLFNTNDILKHTVNDFLLDLLLELGEWEEIVVYLNKMPNNESEKSLFTSALVWFRSRGGDSSTAKKALVRAMKFNKFCVPMMLGIMEQKQSANWDEMYTMSVSRNEDGTVNNDGIKIPMASEYLRNFKKHWVLDPVAMAWLQKIYDEENNGASSSSTKKKKKKKKKKKSVAETNAFGSQMDGAAIPPSAGKTLCAHCNKFGDLSVCSSCKLVSYCSRTCQRSHWKVHKVVCKKKVPKGEVAKVRADTWETGWEERYISESSAQLMPVRFPIGTRIECLGPDGKFGLGTVVDHYYREHDWEDGKIAPYQVMMNKDESFLYCKVDRDDIISAVSDEAWEKHAV